MSKDWFFWKKKMGLIRNCILISLFSVHLPFAVSIGHSVHRLVILKMSLIGTFFVISLYPFTWILPNILRWVFFMHKTYISSLIFISNPCFTASYFLKHLPRYACSSRLFIVKMSEYKLKFPFAQVAYKMGMLSKAGYSLVGVGRLT